MNRLENFATLLDAVPPFPGVVPAGYTVDFLGTLTELPRTAAARSRRE